MFLLLRSAFWLTLAFLVIRPGFDVQDSAASLSSAAMAQGSQFVAERIDAIECQDLTCAGTRMLAAAALRPALKTNALQGPAGAVPFPRPRPDRAG